MVVYTCSHNLEAMLTCIYVAWASKKGHQNIRLEIEPVEQYSLFDEYHHVDPDFDKANSVMTAVQTKISPYVYTEIAYCSMAYEKDVLDTIYHILLLGFSLGCHVLEMVHYRDVMRYKEIRTRLGKETCRFQEIVRFNEIRKDFYVAHIEPKSRLLVTLGPVFMDRMPSEHWMIVDDVHKEAVIHPKDEDFYMKQLTEEELFRLAETEKETDTFTDLWKVFFDSIAIEERKNTRCQRNLFPIWARKHAVEFQ